MSSIQPGMWLVGSQISAGTYTAATRAGCYWQRLRDFSGGIGSILANDFVSAGGTRIVSIAGSDVGFSGDDDCGTWTRSSASVGNATSSESSVTRRSQSVAEIEERWNMNRLQNPNPRRR